MQSLHKLLARAPGRESLLSNLDIKQAERTELVRLSHILCFSIFLGVVELLLKTDHKLTHGLFPILDRHRPALADIA